MFTILSNTRWPRSYRKYILQITQPSQYRYGNLQYRFAVTSGSPSTLIKFCPTTKGFIQCFNARQQSGIRIPIRITGNRIQPSALMRIQISQNVTYSVQNHNFWMRVTNFTNPSQLSGQFWVFRLLQCLLGNLMTMSISLFYVCSYSLNEFGSDIAGCEKWHGGRGAEIWLG